MGHGSVQFEARLAGNVLQGAEWHILLRMRYRDRSRLTGMPEVMVTPGNTIKTPSICFKTLNNLSAIHCVSVHKYTEGSKVIVV